MKKLLNFFKTMLIVGLAAMSIPAFAQQAVTVTVSDATGPLPGANVMQKGTTNGAMTDIDGNALVTGVKEGDVLVVSFIGYTSVEVTVGKSNKLTVVLKEDTQLIDETVVVGYGVQKKESLTSAIAQIGAEDIENTKQIDVVSSLQGKIPGLLITQSNSRPGDFSSSISLRGYGTPLIVVDGVVRTGGKTQRNFWTGPIEQDDMSALQELDPNDIESISVLKDASAAIYGLGAANGVILVTTKKGKVQKPSVSFSANVALQKPTTVRETIDWVDFMRWDNGMRDVSRMAHRWSEEQIKGYETNDPNYLYFDWYNAITKKFSVNQSYNASVRGGTEQVQYYFGFGYAYDDTTFKTDAYNYGRYNINGNVTAKITENLEVNYQTTMRITNTQQPGSYNDVGNITYYTYNISPTVQPYVKSGSGHLTVVPENKHPFAFLDPKYELMDRSNNQFTNTIDVKLKVPQIKGLQLQGTGTYDYNKTMTATTLNKWELYTYEDDVFAGYGNGPGYNFRSEPQYYESYSFNTRLYGRFQANYNTRIGKHDISAMLAAETTIMNRSSVMAFRAFGANLADSFFTHNTINQGLSSTALNSGTRSSTATAGYLARVNYNYAGKYFAEAMARYDGTYMYAPGKRWGLFPSYSLGWRVSEESFIKDNIPALNNLKLRWSDGLTGMAQGSAYAYLPGYTTSGSYSFTEGSQSTGYVSSVNSASLLSWSTARMLDFGIDWELWRGKFGGSFDWYSRNQAGLPASRTASIPDFYGISSLPQMNVNKSQNMGLELVVYHRNNIGQFNYRVQGTATYTRSRDTYKVADATAQYSSSKNYWQSYNTGRWNGYMSSSMYHTDGQYANLNEIAEADIMYNRSKGNYDITPGAYKFVDRNGDGFLTGDDVFYIFSNDANPPLQFGLQFSGSYKNFDFSAVMNGSTLRWNKVQMSGYAGTGYFYYMPVQYLDSYHVKNYGDDPWDPATEWVPGYYPALQGVGQVNNGGLGTYNGYNLPYNYINATFLRLKTLDLGYTVSPALIRKAGIKSLRLSLNMTNLLTFCDSRLKYTDPETRDQGENGGTLPPNKAFNFGVRLNF